jgi:hypothetical protein
MSDVVKLEPVASTNTELTAHYVLHITRPDGSTWAVRPIMQPSTLSDIDRPQSDSFFALLHNLLFLQPAAEAIHQLGLEVVELRGPGGAVIP